MKNRARPWRRFLVYWSVLAVICVVIIAADLYVGLYWVAGIQAVILAFAVWRFVYTWRRLRQVEEDQAFLDTMEGIVEYKRRNP